MTVEELLRIIEQQQSDGRLAMPPIMSFDEGMEAFSEDRYMHEELGVHALPSVRAYTPKPWKRNFRLAQDSLLSMDAQPTLSTEANSAVPALLTTLIDPQVYEIVFAPNRAAIIFGEVKKGSWLDETAMFPVVEHEGEVSSYGDYAESGHAGANTNWPQRQAYLWQVIKEYGERELDRAGLAKINWVSEIDGAANTISNKFSNLTYFFGVASLQNYGLLNDPNLSASLTPALKAYGGTAWFSGGVLQATANEVYNDIVSVYSQLVAQTSGIVEQDSSMTLAMSPGSAVALTATNTFNVNVWDLLKKNFPNMKLETAVQYGALSTINPQGIAAGNEMQLILDNLEGQDVGYCSFNEKMRAHPIIRGLSSFKQKQTAGTWGAIIRIPAGIASMLGI